MHPWKFVYLERDRSKWDSNVDTIMTEQGDPAVDAEVARLMKSQKDFEKSKASAKTDEKTSDTE
jgi:hypothetical protein